MKLSVIIPVFNEVESIQVILKRVQEQNLAHEIVVVDDGSKDGTRDVLKELDGKGGVRVILHEHNKGKGAILPAKSAKTRSFLSCSKTFFNTAGYGFSKQKRRTSNPCLSNARVRMAPDVSPSASLW